MRRLTHILHAAVQHIAVLCPQLCAFGLLCVLCGIASCERRPLEVYYQDRATIMLYVDWLSELGFHPSAMTLNLYDADGNLYRSFPTNDVDSLQLSLPKGRYKLILFNGELDGFATFGFRDIERYDLFRTDANTNTREPGRSWDVTTRYAWEPDERLGYATDSFEVAEDNNGKLHFISYKRRNEAHTHVALYRIEETARPMQTVLHARIHVNGMQNMYGLEASLDGMADGCSMAYLWRNTTTCSVLYQKWGYYFDSDVSPHGWVDLDIPTWGEPHGRELAEQRDSTDNVLRMNFTLRDANHTQLYFEFNVGHLIEYHDPQRDPDRLTPPDVLRHLYLEINREIPLLPDVTPVDETGAGFNAYVDQWEDGGTIDGGVF